MPSSTSARGSSDPLAADREQLPPHLRQLEHEGGLVRFWVGMAGNGLLWALDLQLAYLPVYVGCHRQNLMALYVETTVVLLLMTGVCMMTWRTLRAFPASSRFGGHPDDRARFMALVGVGLSWLFLLIVLGAAIPRVVLNPCE